MPARALAALAVAAVAALIDLRSQRIPNVLTFGAAIAALLFTLSSDGVTGVGGALAGWVVGLLLFLPFFVLGGMGAGDVKLLAALGAWLGPLMIVWVALYSAMAGGILALALSVKQGYLQQALLNLRLLLTHFRVSGLRSMPALTLDTGRGPRLAYAVPIAVGTAIALWVHS